MERSLSGLFTEPEDATPLTPEEQQGLIPTWITHRGDLNEAEQDNILKGVAWSQQRRLTAQSVARDDFSRNLHARMFGQVWRWAGRYRVTEKNLGVHPSLIASECANLFDTIRYWVERTTYDRDELAVRLHHQLVSIHPFPNGNGRHSRMMADLLAEALGGQPFTWGGGYLGSDGDLRRRYIAALRSADAHDVRSLLAFARS